MTMYCDNCGEKIDVEKGSHPFLSTELCEDCCPQCGPYKRAMEDELERRMKIAVYDE